MSSGAARDLWARATPWLAAVALTLLDAAKPLVVDDTAYAAYARHIAVDPGDPYGFQIMWHHHPELAMAVLAPPLLLYWLGGAVALFGEHPIAWKLSLFPFALIFSFSLRQLFARFAPSTQTSLTWMVVLSPAVLPALNLMLDVPALALALAALALFAAAAERGSLGLALAAGLAAGLALQTKYSAVFPLAALAVYAVVQRRAGLGLVALLGAAGVFLGWEGFMSAHYGESHFLRHFVGREAATREAAALAWLVGFLSILGATASAVGLLALASLGARRRRVALLAAAVVLVFGALPFLPPQPVASFELFPDLAAPRFEVLLFALLGLGVLAAVGLALAGALRPRPGGDRAVALFLVAWAAFEVAGFFFASPFLATRRATGLTLALTLGVAHAGAPVFGSAAGRRTLRDVAVFGCALGLLFAAADIFDARARSRAPGLAAERLAELGAELSSRDVWFLGHWGFQFYAEELGMRPLVAGSALRAGDWVLVPTGVLVQSAAVPDAARSRHGKVVVRSGWPWSTLPNAYGGPLPIQGQPEAQMRVFLHRVERDTLAIDPSAGVAR